jgi:tetratricopeptide (TPR) repeat protein
VLVLEAIGGMGKSMLCWQWVNGQAEQAFPSFEGIFWYSFYERGADINDFCASVLAFVQGHPVEDYRSRKTSGLAAELLPVLQSQRWLFVLDGLERVLVAYNRYDAAHIRDEEVEAKRKAQDCIRPADSNLLRGFSEVASSKILISSRLMPTPLMDSLGHARSGVVRKVLGGLDPEDTETLLRVIGVHGNSERMRSYLAKNFGCHPLIAGIVGGLVKRFAPAPGDFDRWADHQADEDALSPEADVVRARHRILWAAFNDLGEDARTLLARIALVSEAVDYETLFELNPRLPERPPQVFPPEEWLLEFPEWIDEYAADKAAYEQYLTECARWRKSVAYAEAQAFLLETIRDVADRGLLLTAALGGKCDLHPVVRGYAVSSIPHDQRDGVAQRVVDHFSSRVDTPAAQVTNINDIRNALQVTRTLLHLGRTTQAADALTDLHGALFWNLEAYALYLSLARPLFRSGWRRAPLGVEGTDLAWLWNNTGLALSMCDEHVEAAAVQQLALELFIDLDHAHGVLVSLRNLAIKADDVDNYADARRIDALVAEATPILGNEEDLALSYLAQSEHSCTMGDLNAAVSYWQQFSALPRPTTRSIYRPGHGEFILARIRWFQERLDDDALSHVERLAREGTNRSLIRILRWLRGEWHLSRGEWQEAAIHFEEHIKMTREVNLDTSWSEARVAFAQLKMGLSNQVDELTNRLSVAKNPPYLALADLYLELGDDKNAREQTHAAYKKAWGVGAPYVDWKTLQQTRRIFAELGDPEPRLPAFDFANQKPLPFESKLRAYLEKRGAENSLMKAN